MLIPMAAMGSAWLFAVGVQKYLLRQVGFITATIIALIIAGIAAVSQVYIESAVHGVSEIAHLTDFDPMIVLKGAFITFCLSFYAVYSTLRAWEKEDTSERVTKESHLIEYKAGSKPTISNLTQLNKGFLIVITVLVAYIGFTEFGANRKETKAECIQRSLKGVNSNYVARTLVQVCDNLVAPPRKRVFMYSSSGEFLGEKR